MGELFYQISAEAALERLSTDRDRGLTESEVRLRRRQHGPNALRTKRQRPFYLLAFEQFNDLLIILLIAAAGLAYYLEDNRGGTILLTIVIVNAAIGGYQEYKAERILELLKTLIKTNATVIRGGSRKEVEEHELVPGDIVFLEEGSAVPADLRLIETNNFSTNDFILTGESMPQEKYGDLIIEREVAITDQNNLAFFGTSVASGNALGVVFATGMSTTIGDLAQASQAIAREPSPLQREMSSLAKVLSALAGVIALALFSTNLLLRAEEFVSFHLLLINSLLFAVGVAAACVPQGLPAQISVALSRGVARLARNNAVVKRLSAVETLGSTTIVCSDKTGTITKNEMTIIRCWVNGRDLEVSGDGYEPTGEISEDGDPLSAEALDAIKQFFEDGFLASHGRTHPPDAEHRWWYATGDPTEAAFMPLAIKAGLSPADLEERFPAVHELPFDSARKRMTIIRAHKGRLIGYMKGAVASVLESCDSIHRNGMAAPLTAVERQAITAKADEFSARSLRVIALAYRDFPAEQSRFPAPTTECHFVFAGLVGMLDPPREGVEDAVRAIRGAHIRLFMITGDDPATAKAVAERIGMEEGPVLTDAELRELSDSELESVLKERSLIFSRVSPMDKRRIVRLLKEMGDVVAVTGDGVNDTLSLKQADIGVAMGGLGSDVAKEAAEMVLVDDNFSTLAAAILEGRTIFQNIKRVVTASINTNIGELSVVVLGFVGLAHGLPIPITAVQILAVDLIAEMLPLMAVTFDPPEPRIMRELPRTLDEHIINRRSLCDLFFFGLLMGAAAYLSFFMVQRSDGTLGMSQAAAYASIVLIQYVNILCRRTSQSVFTPRVFRNRYLWGALIVSLLIVLAIISVPALGVWFGFEPMRVSDWIWPLGGALVYLLVFESKKLMAFRGAAP